MSSPSPHHLNLNHVLIQAGAGAGKTTELVQRVIGVATLLKKEKGTWPALIVTTFTRKSTQELRERLFNEALARGDQDLQTYVQSHGLLHISTIHGVLHLFLKKYGRLIGLPSPFSFLTSKENLNLKKQVLREILRNQEDLEVLVNLIDIGNLSQHLEAFEQYHEWMMEFPHSYPIRINDQMAEALNALKMWLDLSEEIQKIFEDLSISDLPPTWRGFTESFTAFFKNSENTQPILDLLEISIPSPKEDAEFYRNCEKKYEKIQETLLGFLDLKSQFKVRSTPKIPYDLKELREKIFDLTTDIVRDANFSPKFWDFHEKKVISFQFYAQKFSNLLLKNKIERGRLTIDDLELMSLKLLREHPEAGKLFSEEYSYWFVDEYQDTSPRQATLIEKLMGESRGFFVGDPQQSIYLFRGARSEVFEEKKQRILQNTSLHTGPQILEKRENYRSHPALLTYFNDFFRGFSSSSQPMIPTEIARQKNTHPSLPLVAEYWIHEGASSLDPIDMVLLRVQEVLEEGQSPPEQIAILGRRNEDLRRIAQRGIEKGLPLKIHSQGVISKRSEIQDALYLLKFLITPHDNENLIRLLRSPWFQIDDFDLYKIRHRNHKPSPEGEPEIFQEIQKEESLSDWDYLNLHLNFDFGPHFYSHMTSLKGFLESCEHLGYKEAWIQALKSSGFFRNRIGTSGTSDENAQTNLWKLIALYSEKERVPGFQPLEWAAWLLQVGTEGPEQKRGGKGGGSGSEGELSEAPPLVESRRVQLMTIHSAKGLQFDHVILPHCESVPSSSAWGEGLFAGHHPTKSLSQETWSLRLPDPLQRKRWASLPALQSRREMERRAEQEYDRLLYVALTRARRSVTLMWELPPIAPLSPSALPEGRQRSWASRIPLSSESLKGGVGDFTYQVSIRRFRKDEPLPTES